ncbi:MAG: hypothetical protein WDM91_03225 [Rhizomicrobium sp.]
MERGHRGRLKLLIKRSLPLDDDEVDEYIAAWKQLLDAKDAAEPREPQRHSEAKGATEPHELQRRLFDHMYGNLDVLDNKTNSLIQMTGILVAAYAVILDKLHLDIVAAQYITLGVCYAAYAILLCLKVIWVHWSSRDDLEDAHEHMASLIRVRTARTVEFRRAWTFSAISLVSLVVLLLYAVAQRPDVSKATPAFIASAYPLVVYAPYLALVHLIAVYAYDNLLIGYRRRPGQPAIAAKPPHPARQRRLPR